MWWLLHPWGILLESQSSSGNYFLLLEQFKGAASQQWVEPIVPGRCLQPCLRAAGAHIWASSWQSTSEWAPWLRVICSSTPFSFCASAGCSVQGYPALSTQGSQTMVCMSPLRSFLIWALWIPQSMSSVCVWSSGSGRFLSWKVGWLRHSLEVERWNLLHCSGRFFSLACLFVLLLFVCLLSQITGCL